MRTMPASLRRLRHLTRDRLQARFRTAYGHIELIIKALRQGSDLAVAYGLVVERRDTENLNGGARHQDFIGAAQRDAV